ncbi:MAG: sodium-dependent bicarbonate transport family permease [Anaerolineae bacterium]|nr:sodium-dependent bicarbonate transport family permease [Anaerolineae bacterium]
MSGKGFLLLGGGVLIGLISGETGYKSVAPFFVDLFPGMLSLFLLEMGMSVGRQLKGLREIPPFLIIFAVIMPIIHATIVLLLCKLVGISMGGAIVLATIAASSSYITAPATARASLPDAKPIYYLTMSLVITFPFNLTFGLPIYVQLANLFYGAG